MNTREALSSIAVTATSACGSRRPIQYRRRTSVQTTMRSINAQRYAWSAFVLLFFTFAPLAFSAHSPTAAPAVVPQEHRLRLYHTHTGERLDIVYRRGDDYAPDAIAKLDLFLRDHRTEQVRHLDPKLYDILEQLTIDSGHPGAEIDIVCGYRTPWSNQYLRTHTEGVAKNSMHIQAQAIDLRIPGVKTEQLREIAVSLHRGGVGFYPRSNFIHVDTGRVRQWCFECDERSQAGN